MMRRRDFLKLLGVTGVSSGLYGLGLQNLFALESPDGAPKRLLVISHCHGWPYDAWKIRPDGMPEGAPWELNLSSLSKDAFSAPLAPLFPHRNRLLALDGLSLATAELDMDGNRHDTGWIHSWTGNWADFSDTDTGAQSASIDQIISTHIARHDRLPSLEISVDDAGEAGRPISYAINGKRLPVENNAQSVWDRLFSPALGKNTLAPRQRDVLEYAYTEYSRLAPRLGSAQQKKMGAHFELLLGLSDRIEGMATAQCGGAPEHAMELHNYTDRFDAFAELIGAAFACDLTRVISLSLGEMPTRDFGWDHLTDDVHKGLAHEIYNNPDKHQAMTDYLVMHAEQVARLVSVLESLPDSDGNSVMDNTLIVWGSELADGWHGYRHYCPVLIGGSWHFQTGRYLHWPHETPIEILVPAHVSNEGYSKVSGKPHQHLLVSVAQAMGVDTESVGLERVQGQTGELVDCSGALPDLT